MQLVTYGKSAKQAEALIGDAVAQVVARALQAGKPLVIERLDFSAKRDALEGESPGRSRMLSSFAYGRIKTYFLSRGYREGVEVREVNPAYSSVIGRVLFMERYGLSVDQAAALVLARRSIGCSEGIPGQRFVSAGNDTFSCRMHGLRRYRTTPASNRGLALVLALAVKIRVYPTTQQRLAIKTWLDASRWTYNLTVEILRSRVLANWQSIAKTVMADVGRLHPEWEAVPLFRI